MTPDQWKQAAEIFADAIQQPPADREEYLREACRENTVLRREIDRLIQAHERAGDFLSKPHIVAETATLSDSTAEPAPLPDFDDYHILGVLGEGGMGLVYLAEQRQPIRRRVALKVVKRVHDHSSLLARFETERQALALMDHPNIAAVYGAGTIFLNYAPAPDGSRFLVRQRIEAVEPESISVMTNWRP